MNISRRWFLKSAVMTAVAMQLPLLPEGHRVLFIDNSGLLVNGYSEIDGIIRAKVVNGAWDLILNTKKKYMYMYSNASYGYDADKTNELKDSKLYNTLVEVSISKSIGQVREEDKPRKVMIPKFEEKEQLKFENGYPILDINGNGVMETIMVPSLVEAERTITSEYGTLTFTGWEQEEYEIIVDPMNGAGCDYNEIIHAAERKAGIVRESYSTLEDDLSSSFIADLNNAMNAIL